MPASPNSLDAGERAQAAELMGDYLRRAEAQLLDAMVAEPA